ncbi:MAG: DUF473 family protein [Methanoculleaceae archaeon]
MKCAALTGISPAIITELKSGKARTLELHSAHNVITMRCVNPGDHLFITSIDLEDIDTGDRGILVSVLSISIFMRRIEIMNAVHYEERERLIARVRVQYEHNTMVRTVDQRVWGSPLVLDVIRTAGFHAR